MLFSNQTSKIGRCKNFSVKMSNKNTITIYCYENGIVKRKLILENGNIIFEQENMNLSFHKIIELEENLFLARIGKSMRIIQNEK